MQGHMHFLHQLLPALNQVQENFWKEYAKSPEDATKFYYDFSQNSNYIRRDRIKKDMKWVVPSEYGTSYDSNLV